MPTLKITFRVLVFASFWLACACIGHAQPPTVYVSGSGNGGNGCARSAPCKTFKRAYGMGAYEIIVLDTGEYGPLTITRTLKIIAEGAVAEIYAGNYSESSMIKIDMSAGSVVLRGLAIHGSNRAHGIESKVAPSTCRG